MSEIKRYKPFLDCHNRGGFIADIEENADGNYVLYADHAAEVERLKERNGHLEEEIRALRHEFAAKDAEIAALTAALEEVTTILGTFQGLTPETRALCEKKLGGVK